MNKTTQPTKARMTIGVIFFILGIACPLLIPFITKSDLSVALKTGLSGILAFGVPEIFMIIAIAIMGKKGYNLIKNKLFVFLKPLAPADSVNLLRYRVGLFLFCIPLILGWVLPYFQTYISFLDSTPLFIYIVGDIMFIISFFILGGNFWDKFSGLFNHKAIVKLPD
jgi:hypothetical protein